MLYALRNCENIFFPNNQVTRSPKPSAKKGVPVFRALDESEQVARYIATLNSYPYAILHPDLSVFPKRHSQDVAKT
jgi:hypothetical protein